MLYLLSSVRASFRGRALGHVPPEKMLKQMEHRVTLPFFSVGKHVGDLPLKLPKNQIFKTLALTMKMV